MEDSKPIVSPSSPNISAPGNNENESENHRNSQQKSKNFMAPTISASSKFVSPKKKILAEWKPKDLDPKSEIDKLGISNPNPNSNSRSSSEIPPFSSPKSNVVKSSKEEEEEEEEAFVPDSSTVPPYDPLTNYLSPRPKFLRYNPNRKRKLFLERGSKIGSLSSDVSVICQSSCSSDSSSAEGSNHVVQQELNQNNEEIEEELEEEVNWGFKWVFLKSLIVFFAWLLLTVFITSSRNDSTEKTPQTVRVFEVEYGSFVNFSFRAVSLRSLEHRNWMIDQRNESENGEFGGVDDSSQVREIELQGRSFEDEMEESQVSEEEANAKLVEYEMNHIDSENEIDHDDQIEVYDESSHTISWFPDVSPYSVVGSLGDFVGVPQNEEFEVNMLKSNDGVLEEKKVDDDSVPKPASGVEIVGSESSELKDVSSQNIEEGIDETVSAEKSANEVETVARDPSNGVESELHVGDVLSKILEEENIEENEIINARLTQTEFTLLVAITLVVCVGFAVKKCYGKCRRKFIGSGSSRREKFLPVKAGEENDQIHEKADVSQMNLPPRPVVVGAAAATRIVPRVMQLGEVEYGDSQMRSGVVQQEANVFSVPDDRRAKRSKGSSSSTSTTTNSSESHSLSSNLREDGKEKASAVRRSKRIQDRVATSP